MEISFILYQLSTYTNNILTTRATNHLVGLALLLSVRPQTQNGKSLTSATSSSGKTCPYT